MKKVCLIHADNMFSKRPLNNEPHTGVIHTLLEEDGNECVSIYNKGKHEALNIIREFKIDYLGICIAFQPDLDQLLDFIDELRTFNKQCQIIIYGLFVNSDKDYLEKLFSNRCNFIIKGEPELEFLGIVKENQVSNYNISFIKSKIKDINLIPSSKKNSRNELNTHISRGCFHNCLFCEEKDYYTGYKLKSVDTVINEIIQHVETSDKNEECWVIFSDLDFLSISVKDSNWISSFHSKIKELNIVINFAFQTRADRIVKSEDQLFLLKEAGLKTVAIGVESGSEEVLKRYNKRIESSSINVEAINVLKRLKIPFKINFIMYDPVTTLEDIKWNLEFFEKIQFPLGAISSQTPVSFADKVKMFYGSKCHNYYKEEHDFDFTLENNLVSWDFKNKDTSLYYSHVITWRNSIKNNLLNYYKTLNDILYLDKSQALQVQIIGHVLKKVDLSFMVELLDAVVESKDCDAVVKKYLSIIEEKAFNKLGKFDYHFNDREDIKYRGWHGAMNELVH